MKNIKSQQNTYSLTKHLNGLKTQFLFSQRLFNQTEIKTLIEDFRNSLPSYNIDFIGTKLPNILNSVGRKKTDFTQKFPQKVHWQN